MNFDLSDEQQVIADLAEQIFAGQASIDRRKQAEQGDGWDRRLWEELAAANLVGLCLPETAGGSGMGPVELLLTCEAQGRHVAPVPLLVTAVTGAAIAEFGLPGVHDQLLAHAVAGDAVLTTALGSPGSNDPLVPGVLATPSGDGWRLVGTKPAVPYGAEAAAVVVPARTADGGSVVAVVAAGADGVRVEPERTTNHQPAATLHLDTVVPATAVLGTPGDDTAEVTRWLFEHSVVATCGLQIGVAEGALALTAQHVSDRQQFGRPLAAFQAVTQRAADAWITTEAVRVTAYNAAWRLAAGLDARRDVAVAAFWATEGAQHVVTATQHLHGGIGADVDYPVHRYFLWGIQHATMLGAASSHLARLGRLLSQS
jgi:3-oxocholest-4-en-26-oyl-CoA dehydrogenase beta subunit